MQQIAFSFSPDAYKLDEYIQSSSNELAHNAIVNSSNNWGVLPYKKALIINGPKNSGKTFLAKKWQNNIGALFLQKNKALSENDLLNHPAFIIDGFDNSHSEEDVLHKFNAINEAGKYLLITVNNIPSLKLQDLKSRINATNIINIQPPDDQLMEILIFKHFSNNAVSVSREVVSYLLKHLPRNFPEISESLAKINLSALQQKKKITIPFIKTILKI